jgi:hypothetical protein
MYVYDIKIYGFIRSSIYKYIDISGLRIKFSVNLLRKLQQSNNIIINISSSHCAGDQIEKNKMGGACSAYGGGERGVYRVLAGKPEGKRP